MKFSPSCFWFLIWERTRSSLMWPWPVGMVCRWRLTRWFSLPQALALSLDNSISFQDSYFPDYISRSKNTFQKFVTKFHLFVGRCHFPKFNIQILDNNSGLLRWWFPFSVYIFHLTQDIPKWRQYFLIKSRCIWNKKRVQEEDQLNEKEKK